MPSMAGDSASMSVRPTGSSTGSSGGSTKRTRKRPPTKSDTAATLARSVVIVSEVPVDELTELSVDLSSRGTVKITTLPAIPVGQLKAKLKGAKQMGKRA